MALDAPTAWMQALCTNLAMGTPSKILWELPSRTRSMIDAELNAGETLIWIGAPNPRRFALWSIPCVLFAIPWTAFVLYWINEFKPRFPILGGPMLLIGFGLFTSPYWMMRKAKKTVYVLTSKRAIILGGWIARAGDSRGPEHLTDLRRKQRPDGSGDLIFKRKVSSDSQGFLHGVKEHGFFAISDVKAVQDMVRQIAESCADTEA